MFGRGSHDDSDSKNEWMKWMSTGRELAPDHDNANDKNTNSKITKAVTKM